MPCQQSIFEKNKEEMNCPVGSVSFRLSDHNLFDQPTENIKIFEIATGRRVFSLQRNSEMLLSFIYSSPGLGTRIASINMNKLPPSKILFVQLKWNTENISISAQITRLPVGVLSSVGTIHTTKYKVTSDERVIQIGSDGTEVIQFYWVEGGETVIMPTAIESWNDTMQGIEILIKGKSEEEHLFETIVCNYVIMALVSGFEVYTQKRFVEIFEEWHNCDIASLESKFFSNLESDAKKMQDKKDQLGNSAKYLEWLSKERINFQNFDNCKVAYNKGYKLVFGELLPKSPVIENIRDFILFRHKIVHVSTLSSGFDVKGKTVYSNLTTAKEAIQAFDTFINALHKKSLEIQNEQ